MINYKGIQEEINKLLEHARGTSEVTKYCQDRTRGGGCKGCMFGNYNPYLKRYDCSIEDILRMDWELNLEESKNIILKEIRENEESVLERNKCYTPIGETPPLT